MTLSGEEEGEVDGNLVDSLCGCDVIGAEGVHREGEELLSDGVGLTALRGFCAGVGNALRFCLCGL